MAAAFRAAELASASGLVVYADLDLRPTEWNEPADYGAAQRRIMRFLNVVIGTEEEYYAALMPRPETVMDGSPVPADEMPALDSAIADAIGLGPQVMVIKRGPRGATVVDEHGATDIPGFPVDPVNTVGAGDAFAGAFINRRLRDGRWHGRFDSPMPPAQ